MLSAQQKQSVKQLKKQAPFGVFEVEPPHANSTSPECCFTHFILTNKSHPCLLVNQCLLARGARPRYAGASVCNTAMVWSPCGQMPWVWGHTKGFHWRNSKAPESCGSGQADISTTTFPMEFSSGDSYICSANFSNSFTSCCWKQRRVRSPKVHGGGKQVPRGQKSRHACSL